MARVATSKWVPVDPALNLQQKRGEERRRRRARDLGYLPSEHVLKSPLSNALFAKVGRFSALTPFLFTISCCLFFVVWIDMFTFATFIGKTVTQSGCTSKVSQGLFSKIAE